MDIKPFDSTIDLTNDGNISLFFIGTGSAFSKINYQTNLLIVKGEDHILVDCGSLCPYALEKQYNTRLSSIKNLVLTHQHADHIGGVEEYALVNYYVNKTTGNLVATDGFKKLLWKESLRGGIQFSEKGKMTFDDYFNQIKPKLICKKPFEVYDVNVGSINLKLFRTRHVTTQLNSLKNSQISYGLIIDNRILFTGDTQFNASQLEYFLNNQDLNTKIEAIFHDCDFSGYSEGVHASYKQLKTLDSSIKAITYLCHYNSAAEKYSPIDDGFAGFTKPGVYYIF
ncbi:MAG: MBL fold metallo-hydrolase [Treponema sp.]|nr:MBL fold metallo-hydrolase [Treponema sp.]